jgi:hypothetical protein
MIKQYENFAFVGGEPIKHSICSTSEVHMSPLLVYFWQGIHGITKTLDGLYWYNVQCFIEVSHFGSMGITQSK